MVSYLPIFSVSNPLCRLIFLIHHFVLCQNASMAPYCLENKSESPPCPNIQTLQHLIESSLSKPALLLPAKSTTCSRWPYSSITQKCHEHTCLQLCSFLNLILNIHPFPSLHVFFPVQSPWKLLSLQNVYPDDFPPLGSNIKLVQLFQNTVMCSSKHTLNVT